MGTELSQAFAMIDAFTSVGARTFDITILDINGDEVKGLQRTRCSLAEIRRMIGKTLQDAERSQHNVIIRPRSTGPKLIQLDDLNADKAARIAPYAFIEILTSPGNFQSWVAVSDSPKDPEAVRELARNLKRGAGADHSATAAVRIAGSRNFKRKYAPHFPVVQITQATPGRLTTVAQLEQAGLVAAQEAPVPLPPASVPRHVVPQPAAGRRWPDYQQAFNGAPRKDDGTPDRSLADFMWCKWAVQRGWSVEETAEKLVEVSPKAQERIRVKEDKGYALLTARNAARALDRERAPRHSPLKSTAGPG